MNFARLLLDFLDYERERVEGIEPSCVAWKATVLPLNYTRVSNPAILSDTGKKCNSDPVRPVDSRRTRSRMSTNLETIAQP